MAKQPSFQFYPGDWLNDAALRMVSVGARGCWADMICLMHQGTPYGYLKVNHKVILPDNLARILGATLADTEGWLAELEHSGVFSRDDDGAIYSRRMVRDQEIRLKRAAGGSLGGNPALVKASDEAEKVNGKVASKVNLQPNLRPTPSSSSSSSSVSDSDSGACDGGGEGTQRPRLAAVECSLEVGDREKLIATVIRKQNPGGGASVREITSLDRDDVAAWFSKHIATRHPLCGPTALDLLLVLCFARSCSRAPRAITNKVALFAAGMKSGKWLDSAEGCGEEWEWLVEQFNSGRIKFVQQEVAA